jgi:hypothetical protein
MTATPLEQRNQLLLDSRAQLQLACVRHTASLQCVAQVGGGGSCVGSVCVRNCSGQSAPPGWRRVQTRGASPRETTKHAAAGLARGHAVFPVLPSTPTKATNARFCGSSVYVQLWWLLVA